MARSIDRPARALALLLALAAHTSARSDSCTTDHDCNLNGACVRNGGGGVCRCLAAWRGPSCGELALLPAVRGAGLHSAATARSSAWGGAVVKDDGAEGLDSSNNNQWLMFAAEMVGGCGINSWESNSRVVRASAPSLDAPFVVDAEIKPAFGSEPTLARLGDDAGWLLYSIGNSSSSLKPRQDCRAGYSPKAAPANGTGGNFKHFVPVEIASAATLAGPWTLRATIGNGDFNPSPLLLPNGTALLMWRHLARTHMVSASSWEGPYAFNGSDGGCPVTAAHTGAVAGDGGGPGCRWWHLFDAAVDARGIEDPFMFVQPAAHDDDDGGGAAVTYHALFHDHHSFGGHAFSSDGVSWNYSSTAPYSNLLTFTDGGSVLLQRRERPHLVLDEEGYITHLTTAAQPPPTAAKSPPASGYVNDYSFTSVQPVRPQSSRLYTDTPR